MKTNKPVQKFTLILTFCTLMLFLSPLNGDTAADQIQTQEILLQKLDDPAPKIVLNAVHGLAQTGSLDAYRTLLTRGDTNLLRQYASRYRNRNGTEHLDPEIEASIIKNIDNPVIMDPLLSFFHKNIYQSTALFDRLIRMTPDFKQTRVAVLMVKALVATNLPDIEQRVLDHAVRINTMVDQRFWWLIPQIERNYFDFFLKRGYKPAISFMQSILDETHYSKVRGNPQTHLFNRQRYIYYVLDKFPSSYVGDIFIKQVGKLSGVERDTLFSNELKAAGEYAVKHSLTYEQKEETNKHLIQILKSIRSAPQTKTKGARTDVMIRIYIIKLLGKTGTETSGKALVMELVQTASKRGQRSYATLVSQIMQSITSIPADVELDVPEFLEAARKLDNQNRFLSVPPILLKYKHPEGYAYLLSFLEDILTTEEDLKRLYGYNRAGAFMNMVKHLSSFDETEYMEKTLNEIDTLFQNGKLSEDLYIRVSEYLIDTVDIKSPIYTALMEKKEALKEARRKEKAAEKKRKWKEKMNARFAEETSPEGIKKNILALERGNRRRSARWLIVAGKDIIPHAHKALRDPAVSARIKFSLIDILGAINDPRSIKPIIEAARAEPNSGLHKAAFLALGQMTPSRASFKFAAKQLENKRTPRIQQSAMAYFILQRDKRALKWAQQYADSGGNLDLQAAGLYLLARLGQEQAKDQILDFLKKTQDRAHREILLRALAELTTLQEFRLHTRELFPDTRPRAYEKAENIAEFRHSTGKAKSAAAEKLLRSGFIMDKKEAARYLIAQNEVETIWKYLQTYRFLMMPIEMAEVHSESPIGMIILVEARKMGLRIEQISEGIRFIKK